MKKKELKKNTGQEGILYVGLRKDVVLYVDIGISPLGMNLTILTVENILHS